VDGLARKGWLAELQAAGLEPGPARHTPWTTDGDYDDTKIILVLVLDALGFCGVQSSIVLQLFCSVSLIVKHVEFSRTSTRSTPHTSEFTLESPG
jgi:hypothetical protein